MFSSKSNTCRIPPKTIRTSSVLALLEMIFGLIVGTDWSSAATVDPSPHKSQIVQTATLDSEDQNTSKSDELWKDVNELSLALMMDHQDAPKQYRLLQLNETLFSSVVSRAPLEFTTLGSQAPIVLLLPLPDGRLWRFRIVESPVLSSELADKFPQIKTYSGQSMDDPTATVRFSWTPKGLNAVVISEQGTFVIAPTGSNAQYLSYSTHDLQTKPFECSTPVEENAPSSVYADTVKAELSVANGTLRRYRLAVSVTPEFIFAVGGETVATAGAGTIAAVTTYVNNVRAIYERETGVSFNLVAVWNPAFFNVPLTNGNLQLSNQQNQSFLDSLFFNGFSGSASYDIGLALGHSTTTPGGLASFGGDNAGGACQIGFKAQVSALVNGPSTNDYWDRS